eukprot:3460919-Rhodomonas_salina.1
MACVKTPAGKLAMVESGALTSSIELLQQQVRAQTPNAIRPGLAGADAGVLGAGGWHAVRRPQRHALRTLHVPGHETRL